MEDDDGDIDGVSDFFDTEPTRHEKIEVGEKVGTRDC